MRGTSLLDLKDADTTDQNSGLLCTFPAVLDVVLFNREEALGSSFLLKFLVEAAFVNRE